MRAPNLLAVPKKHWIKIRIFVTVFMKRKFLFHYVKELIKLQYKFKPKYLVKTLEHKGTKELVLQF